MSSKVSNRITSSSHPVVEAPAKPQRPSKAARAIARLARTPLAQRMVQDMILVGFGERTQESYLRSVWKLAEYFQIAPDQLSEEQVREYFLMLRTVKDFAPRSLKLAYCRIRLFYTQTVPRDWGTLKQLRVLKQRKLSAVLSVAAVERKDFIQAAFGKCVSPPMVTE